MKFDWRKAGSLRVAGTALIAALVVGAIAGALWQPLTALAIPVGILIWIGLVREPTVTAYCPHCSKRVKFGAKACHHCGRDAVAAG